MDSSTAAPPAVSERRDDALPASSAPTTAPVPAPGQTPAPKGRRLARLLGRLALAVVLLAAVLYAAVWGYLVAVDTLGPLGLLTFVLFVGLLIAIAGPWLLIRFGAPLHAAIGGVARWIAARRGTIRSQGAAHPETTAQPGWLARLMRLLGVRFVWDRTAGIWVTLGLVAASALAWAFALLVFQVVSGGTVAGTDLCILNLVATLRTPTLDAVMYALTFAASVPAIGAVTAVAVGVALLVRRYEDALLLALAPVAGGLFVLIVKALVARARPPLVDARLVLDGFSFPSGHATVATTVYGTILYVTLRGWPRRYDFARVLIGVGVSLLIFAIGLSRVYLGVHYPSDVLAGWAAGVFWLVLVVVAEHLWLPARMPVLSAPRRVVALAGSLALLVLAGGTLVATYPALPPPPPGFNGLGSVIIAPDAVQATILTRLPHTTETIFGAPQEPISLVFVGAEEQLDQAFANAGWIATQKPGVGNVGTALYDGIAARPDPAGPIAPSFVADEPNALAYSQPVGDSFAQRHHVRIWRTNVVTSDGQPVWLGTASFDEGFGLSHTNFLPTHHIAPDIDIERDYLASSLGSTGAVATSQTFQLVPPESGTNFVGDPFQTDGRAVLLVLA